MSTRKLPGTSAAAGDVFGPEAKRLADLRSLPFVVDREPTPDNGARRAFWRDANSGNGIADELLGGAWARCFRDYQRCGPVCSQLLVWIVRDMRSLGRIGGVEVGLLETLDLWASGRTRRSRVAGGGP